MTRGGKLLVPVTLAALVAGLALGQRAVERAAAAQNRAAREAPRFEVDPRWPDIPDSVTMGEVTSVAVDRNDHVWILHRPETAPAVLEFDGSGRYLGGWGGPSDAYEWPAVAHGISVDYKNNVWIGGRSPDPPTDDMLLKFTAAGELLLQIGRRGASGGNADTMNLRQPADQFVHEGTNELLVADGYGNRRVIVFDADSGEYKRMWGGFGNRRSGRAGGPGGVRAAGCNRSGTRSVHQSAAGGHRRPLRHGRQRRPGVRVRPGQPAHPGVRPGRHLPHADVPQPRRRVAAVGVARGVLAGPRAAFHVRGRLQFARRHRRARDARDPRRVRQRGDRPRPVPGHPPPCHRFRRQPVRGRIGPRQPRAEIRPAGDGEAV